MVKRWPVNWTMQILWRIAIRWRICMSSWGHEQLTNLWPIWANVFVPSCVALSIAVPAKPPLEGGIAFGPLQPEITRWSMIMRWSWCDHEMIMMWSWIMIMMSSWCHHEVLTLILWYFDDLSARFAAAILINRNTFVQTSKIRSCYFAWPNPE